MTATSGNGSIKSRLRIQYSVCLAMLFTLVATCSAADDDLAAKILLSDLKALVAARAMRHSAAKWEISILRTIPKHSISFGVPKPVPDKDEQVRGTIKIVLDLKNGRVAQEYKGQEFHLDAQRFVAVEVHNLSDGQQLQSYRPKAGNEDINGRSESDRHVCEIYNRTTDRFNSGLFYEEITHPVLAYHGILYTPKTPLKPIPLIPTYEDDFVGFAVKSVEERGTSFQLVEIPGGDGSADSRRQLFFEMNDDALLNSYVTYLAGSPVSRWTVTQMKDESGRQIPMTWLLEKYNNGSLFLSIEASVQRYEFDTPADISAFRVLPTTGMYVYDEQTDHSYHVKDNGELEDGTVAARRLISLKSQPRSSKALVGLLLVNGLLLSAIGVFALWRLMLHRRH